MDSLDAAAATLARATGFLASRPRAGGGATRMTGNTLRELDRFLSILIDEIAGAVALPEDERARLARQHNTPNKLRALRAALALPSPDHERLRAIGRSCGRMLHRGHVVAPSGARARHRKTTVLIDRRATPAVLDVRDVAFLYARLGAELLSDSAPWRRMRSGVVFVEHGDASRSPELLSRRAR